MRPVVGLLVLLAPLLAGCLGGDAEVTPAPELPQGEDAAQAGTVELTVLDPGRVPVPDVAVTLESAAGARSTATNVLGIARFTDVPPGNITLRAQAAGFLVANLTFPLAAGQTAAPEVVLERDAPRTFIVELEFEGFFECAATYFIITGECMTIAKSLSEDYLGVPYPFPDPLEGDNVYIFDVAPGWTKIRITQTWTDPEFSLGTMMRLNLEPAETYEMVEYDARFARAEGVSPLVVEVYPEVQHENATEGVVAPEDGGAFQTRTYHQGIAETHQLGGGPQMGVGAAYQQRFTVAIEIHYEG